MFEVPTVRTKVDNSNRSLLATVVRKLLVLTIKCLSIVVATEKGNFIYKNTTVHVRALGCCWIGQLETLCTIPGSSSEDLSENSLRNLILEVLLDQDTAIVDALTYCLTFTQVVAR